MRKNSQKQGSARAKITLFIWKNLPRIALICLIIFCLVLFKTISNKKKRLTAEKKSAVSQEKPLFNTIALKVTPGIMQDRVNLPGEIKPWTRLELKAKVGGSITEVLVDEGDRIGKGDTIAVIEKADYEINLRRAEAAYKLALANYQRDKKVHARGGIPTADLESRETAVQTARAGLDQAELQLSRCTVKAPIGGVINRLDAKIGLLVNTGTPIAEILQLNPVKAVVGIPESDISEVRKFAETDISITALDRIVTGQKHFLASAPDSAARSYRLELAIDNPDGEILPGMFVRARLVKKKVEDALAVPFYSVITLSGKQYLFVEKNGTAEKREVELGVMEGWMVQILSGLKPGEKVIVEGHRDIEDGQKIKVIKTLTKAGDQGI